MTSPSDSATGASPRRSLVSLAGLLIVLLVVNGAIGLFGVRYAGLKHAQNLDTLDTLVDALDDARQAQVHFKVQVQEWKNVLLRGQETQDFERYFDSFERHESAVRDRLTALGAMAGATGIAPEALDALLTEHARLATDYRQALAQYDRSDAASAARVDRQVRGVDRDFNDRLDALAERTRLRADELREEIKRQTAAREDRIEWIVIAGTAITVVLLLLMLFLSTRRR